MLNQIVVGVSSKLDVPYSALSEYMRGVGGAKVTAGASYQYTSGVTEEASTSYSYGTGLELAGTVAQFPAKVGTKDVFWPEQCEYGIYVRHLLRTRAAAIVAHSSSEEVSLAEHEPPYHVTTEMPGNMALAA